MDMRQRMKLTGTNSSSELTRSHYSMTAPPRRETEKTSGIRQSAIGIRQLWVARFNSVRPTASCLLPTAPPRVPRGLCFAGLVALAGGTKPDPIPNSAVKPLSANGTKPQGLGESVAARPAKHSQTTHENHPSLPTHPRGVEQSGSSSGS